MKLIHDLFYEVLLKNATYQAREHLLGIVTEAVSEGDSQRAGIAAESLNTLVRYKREGGKAPQL